MPASRKRKEAPVNEVALLAQKCTQRPGVSGLNPDDHGQSQPKPRPSQDWRQFDPNKAPAAVTNIIVNGNWPFLCDLAVRHHPSKSDTLSCTAELERVARGFVNVAIELSFSDGTFWVARVKKPDDEDEFERETEMLSEIATMRLVAQRTSIPVPQVYCYDCSDNNTFGFPYMLMSALPGRTLTKGFAFSVPKKFQPKIASQMADCVRQLSKITFSEIGQIWTGVGLDEDPHIVPFMVCGQKLGPFNSSTAYYRGIQQATNQVIVENFKGDVDWPEWRRFSDININVIPFLVYPALRRGSFPLWHRDFHVKNILVDDDYNITGVLDWTGARISPWEDFATYGDILTLPYSSEEENKSILEFRATLVQAFRKLESDEQVNRHGTHLSDILGSGIIDLHSVWGSPVPNSDRASEQVLHLLRLLFGEETNFDNYRARQRKLPRRLTWLTGDN